MSYSLRPLCADDEPFLWQMLYYAARVDAEAGRTIDDMKNDPVMPNYITGWGRPGDLGFVAVDDDNGAPLGAAWVRLPSAEDGGGYSTVTPGTPELAVAVQPAFVGQGIGTQLMKSLLAAARGRYPAVILNVRVENPALRLYTRLGFTPIRELINRVGGRSVEMIYPLTQEQHIMENQALIRAIEEASLNAWPAHRTMIDQGWLLRFADGYTRRSNSVNPIYAVAVESDDEVIARIVRCEGHYRARNQPTIFKLTPLSQPAHLDDLLAARGYVHDAPTTVRRRSLSDPLTVSESEGDVHIADTVSDTWIEHFALFSDLKDSQVLALRGILQSIVPTTGYATLTVNGEAVTCALAVVEGPIVGLYDIVTAAAARGRGYGVHMLAALLAWAKQQGAEMSYLQVMDNNLPAKRLYDKLGFTELYPYWYRVQRG